MIVCTICISQGTKKNTKKKHHSKKITTKSPKKNHPKKPKKNSECKIMDTQNALVVDGMVHNSMHNLYIPRYQKKKIAQKHLPKKIIQKNHTQKKPKKKH
jgi:hypothetical protein